MRFTCVGGFILTVFSFLLRETAALIINHRMKASSVAFSRTSTAATQTVQLSLEVKVS